MKPSILNLCGRPDSRLKDPGPSPRVEIRAEAKARNRSRSGGPCATVALTVASGLLVVAAGSHANAAISSSHAVPLRARRSAAAPPTQPSEKCDPMLAKGRFLVASERISDPHFSRSVVLLVDYGQKGAAGLIINRPTPVKLSEALPDIEGLEPRPETAYLGGPVARGQRFLLVRTDDPPADAQRVFGEVYLSTSRRLLERLLAGRDRTPRFRLYVGYAGWAPGQLEREVCEGGWQIVPADAETIFDEKASEIWRRLYGPQRGQWVQPLGHRGARHAARN